MILRVFTKVGMVMSEASAYGALTLAFNGSPFSKSKAVVSLGGAVNGGILIRFKRNNCTYL